MVSSLIIENLSQTTTGGFTVKWYRPVDNSSKDTIQVCFKPVVDVFIPVMVKLNV